MWHCLTVTTDLLPCWITPLAHLALCLQSLAHSAPHLQSLTPHHACSHHWHGYWLMCLPTGISACLALFSCWLHVSTHDPARPFWHPCLLFQPWQELDLTGISFLQCQSSLDPPARLGGESDTQGLLQSSLPPCQVCCPTWLCFSIVH